MKRLILTMAVMGVPAAVLAQQDATRLMPEGVVLAAATAPAASESNAGQAGSANQGGPRRRPSMVGYIENADIGNKVRMRFDAGMGIKAPDRAEFFYAKCGCYRSLPAKDAAFDPDAPGPGPGVLTEADYTQFNINAEYALSGRFSLVADLPVRSLKPLTFAAGTGSFGKASGVSDLRAGVKMSMVSDGNSQLTLQALATAPTGDSLKGLGTNHWSIEPAVLYNAQLSEHVGLEAQFGTVFATNGSKAVPTSSPDKFSGTVIYYGVGPSVDIYSNGRTRVAPVVELVGWRVVDGYSTAEGGKISGINVVNLKIDGRVAVGSSSLYVGYGKALTDATWYDELIRFEYRYGF